MDVSNSSVVEKWIASLPTNERHPDSYPVSIRIRGGNASSLTTIGIVAIEGRKYTGESDFAPVVCHYEDLTDNIMTVLDENGFETGEIIKARLHATNHKGKQIRTKSLQSQRQKIANTSSEGQAITALTSGLLQMASELRKCVGTLSETLAQREALNTELIDDALSARAENIDSMSQLLAMELIAEQGVEEAPDDGMKKEALGMFEKVFGMMQGGPIKPPTSDQVKSWTSNKEWLHEVMKDPHIQADILNAFVDAEEADKSEPAHEDHPETD